MSAARSAIEKKQVRNRTYGKIHTIWGNLRPDLRKGSADYKEALYMFAEAELKKPQIGSFTELTQAELGDLIAALEREHRQPALYTSESSGNVTRLQSKHSPASSTSQPSEPVEHLASLNQRFAIARLFGYLGWGDYGREQFLQSKFRCKRIEMLLQKQAHNCIRILLNCAASKYWKAQGKTTVSKPMISAAIPRIKKEIGID
jgi:hypothetical protein